MTSAPELSGQVPPNDMKFITPQTAHAPPVKDVNEMERQKICDSEGRYARILQHVRLVPMRPRSPHEEHRVASSLELFFDLVFVLGVGNVTETFAELLLEEKQVLADGLARFVLTFFMIWWAWMNYTWFGTSFDNGDWLYRVMTLTQMCGALVVSAAVGQVFQDRFKFLLLGYIIMRFALVSQWIRASFSGGSAARPARVYAVLITILQVLWILWFYVFSHRPAVWIPVCVVFACCEISIPVVAEMFGHVPWHPHHITERYGLFTLIQLGESMAGASKVMQLVVENDVHHDYKPKLLALFITSFIIGSAMWWIYFWAPHHTVMSRFKSSLFYGYVHFPVFMALAAFAAGVEANAEVLQGRETHLSEREMTFLITVPVAIFLLAIWGILIWRHANLFINLFIPFTALVIKLDCFIHVFPTILTTVFMVLVVILLIVYPPKGDHYSKQCLE